MVKFVSYDGHYPCLCTGKLVLEIDGELVTFGGSTYKWKSDKDYNPAFWKSGGSVWFSAKWEEEHIEKGEWRLEPDDIPERYQKYSQEMINVFNENVPYGCCGGCL